MSVDVYLRKEKVGSIEESNVFDFRLLCEQVGYQTEVLKNSLYVRPWLEGKRLVIDLPEREIQYYASRLPFLDMIQSILSAYGMETYILSEPYFPSQSVRSSRMANKAGGDLYLLIQANSMASKNRIHLWYGYSFLKQSKSLADCLYASLHALEQAGMQKPSLLWNPWSSLPYKSLLEEINMPGVVIEYLYASGEENDERNVRQFAAALCQGVLAYFQVPVLSPSIHPPEIWELVAKYVLKLPFAENFLQEESEVDKIEPSLEPEMEIFDQEAIPPLPVEEPEQNPTENSEHEEMVIDPVPEQVDENEPSETDIGAESFGGEEGELSSAEEEKSGEEPKAAEDDEVLERTPISSLSEKEHGQNATDVPDPVPSQEIPQPKQQKSAAAAAANPKAHRPQKPNPTDPWSKLASLPHWNHSSLMKPNQPQSYASQQEKSQPHRPIPAPPTPKRTPRPSQLSQNSYPADATEINPFAQRNNQPSTLNPFRQQRPNR